MGALQAGSKENIVPSVQILAMVVQFGVRSAVKKVPGFLRCFPNLETLHVHVKLVNLTRYTCCIGNFAILVAMVYLAWS